MTKKLVAREEVAFDVDRERMVQTLKHNKLAEPLAYIRDILGAIVATEANNLQISTTPRKIILAADGAGMTFTQLDEKLANMFTGEGLEEVATGILCAFDAGIQEVTVESYPKEGQAYRLRITGEEGNIQPSLPELLDNKPQSGMKITLSRKAQPFLKQKISDFPWRRRVPEYSLIERTCKGAYTAVTLNRRKLPRKEEENMLVTVPIENDIPREDTIPIENTIPRYNTIPITETIPIEETAPIEDKEQQQISGTVGLKTFFSDYTRSEMYLYRKRLFHDFSEFRRVDGITPFIAHVNCDKLQVDISGAKLQQDALYKKIVESIEKTLPKLYEACLNYQGKEQREKKKHLRSLLLTHLWTLKENYLNSYNLSEISDSDKEAGERRVGISKWCYKERIHHLERYTTPHNFVSSFHRPFASPSVISSLEKRLLEEKLFPTKDQGEVSLNEIFTALVSGKQKLYLDFRGYNYEGIGKEDMVLRPVDDDRNAEMILSSFDYITPLENAHILGRWNYYRRESELAKKREERRKKINQQLPLPLLYRPIQAGRFLIDTLLLDEEKDTFTWKSAVILPPLLPFFALAMAGGIAAGAIETIYQIAQRTASITVDTCISTGTAFVRLPATKSTIAYLVADTQQTIERNAKSLERIVKTTEKGMKHTGKGIAIVGRTTGTVLYTGGRYTGKGIAIAGRTTGTVLYTGGRYAGRGIAAVGRTTGTVLYTGAKYTGKGMALVGKGIALTAGVVTAGIAAPIVYGYIGIRAGVRYTAKHTEDFFIQHLPDWEKRINQHKQMQQKKKEEKEKQAEEKRKQKELIKAEKVIQRKESLALREKQRRLEYEQREDVRRRKTLREIVKDFYTFSKKMGLPEIQITSLMEMIDGNEELLKIYRESPVYHSRPVLISQGKMYVIIDHPDFEKLSHHLFDTFESVGYLGTAILKESTLPRYDREKFQLAFLQEREKRMYQQCVEWYCSGQEGQEKLLLEKLEKLPQYAQEEVLYRLLDKERKPTIDIILEQKFPEQLEQAGRKRIKEITGTISKKE